MNCDVHPDEEAIAVCVSCNKPLCESCRVKFNDRNYCHECVDIVKTHKYSIPKGNLANKFDDILKKEGVYDEIGSLSKPVEKLFKKGQESLQKNFKASGSKNRPQNPLEEIKTAKELLDAGVITKEEFDEIKKKCLERV